MYKRQERFTARVLQNGFTKKWHGRERELRQARDVAAAAWSAGWDEGDPDLANTFVGEATGLIATIEPAADVIERITSDAARLLHAARGS